MMNRRMLWALAAGAAALGLAGCAAVNQVWADVSSFGEWPGGRAPGSYAFERLPSQQADAQRQQRLEDAARAGLMDESLHAGVSEAYRFLLGLRLRVQLRRLAEGKAPSSEVALAELSGIERSRLKDAFRAVKTWQERAAYHYQATVA